MLIRWTQKYKFHTNIICHINPNNSNKKVCWTQKLNHINEVRVNYVNEYVNLIRHSVNIDKRYLNKGDRGRGWEKNGRHQHPFVQKIRIEEKNSQLIQWDFFYN